MTPGAFITFEGGEGAGKTTQIGLLAKSLEKAGASVLTTREPGGSPTAEAIRQLLLRGDSGPLDGITEVLLHYAARRDHMLATIIPALQRGEWVLCDRFADSTRAYQGAAMGVRRKTIDAIHAVAVGDFAPDLTLILDLPVEMGMERAHVRAGYPDRYELMDLDFHRRVREGFLEIAAMASERCVVIDASQTVEAIAEEIKTAVRARLGDIWNREHDLGG